MEKTIADVKKRIGELEDVIFYLEMVDRWTQQQRELFDKYNEELTALKALVIEALVK
jgi:hypothetical protein